MDVELAHGGAPILVACLSRVSDNTHKFFFMFLSASNLTSIGKAISWGCPGANWPIVGLTLDLLTFAIATVSLARGRAQPVLLPATHQGKFACRV